MVKEPLHVKYRPKTWDEVVGEENKKMVKELKAVLEQGEMKIILLSGPTGCGKTSIAYLIKSELKCSNASFLEINAADERGINTVREILHQVRCRGLIPWKIVFFDEVHGLTPLAQEVLLKDMENNPHGTYFIFATTNPEELILTLRNRCTHYQVFPLNPSEVKDLLKNLIEKEGIVGVTEKVLEEIAFAAGGSPRQAEVLLGKIKPLAGEETMLHAITATPIGDETVIGLPQAPDWLYPTFHLKNFESLNKATGLYGKGYKLPVKAIWYVLHGQIIKTKIVKLGGVETDCRMNFAFILKSGRGKKEIEDIITKVCNDLGEKVTKPTSYHSEQLVGKVVQKRKTGEYLRIKGHLGDDILIFDDAIELVKSQRDFYRESRRYITTALDPIKKNLVTKRQTGIPQDEALIYHPKCSIQILLQPFNICDEVAKGGFFRRFLFLLPEIDLCKETFSQKTQGNGMPKSQALNIFVNHLKDLMDNGSSSKLTFSEDAKSRFNELHKLLFEYGEKYSKKVSRYTEMIGFPLQNLFLKMIAILANSEKRTEVSIRDVEMAFVDLLEFLDSNFEYVERKVQGSLDYDDKDQPTGDDLKMLTWLKDEGALSLEASKISIGGYQGKIVSTFSVSPDVARNWYKKHVKKGWIEGKQEGAHGSKVRLTFKLDEDEGGQGGRVVTEYKKIIAHYAEEKAISPLPGDETRVYPMPGLKEDTVPPYHPDHPEKTFKMEWGKDVEEREEEREQLKWETLLEGFDCKQYLMKVSDRKKRLVFNFLFADAMSRWTIERTSKKGVPTGYELDLAFLKDGERKLKIKKWIMDFHTRKANELVRILEDLKY